MKMMGLRALAPMTLAISLHVACSSSQTSDGPTGAAGDGGAAVDVSTCTVASRTGKSSCQSDTPPGFPAKPPISCSAGTFCVTAGYDAKCQGGCESDENCGPSERCVRCGSGAGKCRTCNITDGEACAAPPKPDAAPETCERDTFFDKDCTSPGKAFACPSTLEPSGQGTCALTSTPGIWCCGGGVKTCERSTVIDQSECKRPGPTGPRPPKGYTCEADSEPADPKCVQGDVPTHWCCPQ